MKQSINPSSFRQTISNFLWRCFRWLLLRAIAVLLIYLLLLKPAIEMTIKGIEYTAYQVEATTEWVLEQFAKVGRFVTSFDRTPAKLTPYKVYTDYFLDDSPPGAYDFTLELNNEWAVPIPAPCNGTIKNTWFQGKNGGLATGRGAGQIVELYCDGKDYYWLMGHLVENSPPRKGTRVVKGEAIGFQGLTGRTSGYHIHAQIHRLNGKRITNRKITRPIVEKYLDFLATSSRSLTP